MLQCPTSSVKLRSDQTRQTQIQSLETLVSRCLIIWGYLCHSGHLRLTFRGKKDDVLARSFLNRYFSTRPLSMSIMADITTVAALYLLYKSQKCRKTTRRRVWVHEVLRRRTELGEFHCLLQELRLDDDRFQRYLRLTGAQFEDLLARVGAHTQLQLASPPCWSECKQPYVSDVDLNTSLIGCRGVMPPEKFDIFNFIHVASDDPDASFAPC